MTKAARIAFLMVGMSLLAGAVGTHVSSGKERLRWLTFDQGLAEAQKTGKKVLVDVYTDWCGWCKKMDASTYSDERVAGYLQQHYVLIKLNAESSSTLSYKGEHYSEQDLARAFGVNGYPTTLFLKSNGDPITNLSGYSEAGRFRDIIAFIAEDHYLTKKFDEYLKAKGI